MKTLLTWAYALPLLVLFLSVGDIAAGHRGMLPTGATTLALVGLLPLAACELLSFPVPPRMPLLPSTVWRNRIPLALFGIMAFLAILLSILPGSVWDEGGKWILLVPYGFAIIATAVVSSTNRSLHHLLPIAISLSLALLLWSIHSDLTVPGTFTDPNERAAGFSGNANYTALISVMLCSAALDYELRRCLLADLFLLLLSGAIVLISLSRSGLLGFGVLVTCYISFRYLRRRLHSREIRDVATSLLAATLIVLATTPLFSRQLGALQEQSRFRRAVAGRQVDDGSAASRWAAAQDALDRISASPVLGHGTGYARRMPELPHNMYLQQWVNNGIVGFTAYVAFLAASFWTFWSRRNLNGFMLVATAAIGGLFSHNILDQRPFLILYGLLLGAPARSYSIPARAR